MRHGDSCIASEAARTARRCEPLSRYVGGGGALPGGARVLTLTLTLSLSVARYVDAVAPYLAEHGVRTVFLATDSEEVLPSPSPLPSPLPLTCCPNPNPSRAALTLTPQVLRDARAIGAARGLSFLWLRNVSRTRLTTWC